MIQSLPAAVVNGYFKERMSLHLTSLNPKIFTSSMWKVFRAYMYMSDPEAPNKTHYACQYC